MRGSWRVGRIMGIDIAVDLSWFLILFLLVYTLGFIQFPRQLHPRTFITRPDAVSIGLGIAASLLLFASVLAHELSHSWMAVQRGIPVNRITLFIFGGVAQIADEPDRAFTEFLIAIMGPLMSVALAAIFGAAWVWLQLLETWNNWDLSDHRLLPLILLTAMIAQANGALALFNLAPGFPLDGGRVLRAVLWGVFHDVRRATRIATRAGQLIAVLLVGLGGWVFLTDLDMGGVWYVLIGFFLWSAARDGYRQTVMREALRGVRVEQLMARPVESVPANLTIAEFVSRYVIPYREQTFAVSDGAALLGLVSADHVQGLPQREWQTRCVADLMTPRARLAVLDPQETAAAALARLSRSGLAELPVFAGGALVGFLGRGELERFLRFQSQK